VLSNGAVALQMKHPITTRAFLRCKKGFRKDWFQTAGSDM